MIWHSVTAIGYKKTAGRLTVIQLQVKNMKLYGKGYSARAIASSKSFVPVQISLV